MAEVNTDSGGGGGKHEKKRAKKSSTRIDMTPMVDLAFLLLTFFVLTSTFNKPKTMEISYPAKPKTEDQRMKVNNAITFIMSGDDKLYYYYGEFYVENNKDGKPATVLSKTDYSSEGLRKLLLNKNRPTIEAIKVLKKQFKNGEIADTTFKRLVIKEQGKKEALTVLVKSDDKAEYRNMINLVDELNICNIGKYAVVDMMPQELALVEAENNK
jgi:biopolymer transport protein ExbD